MKFWVVSTGLNAPTKQKCLDSVARQEGAVFEHLYVEAGEWDPPKSAGENLFYAIRHAIWGGAAAREDVIVCVDGDDWLPHPLVLSRLAREYQDPEVWLTYGSFRYADYRRGFAAPYPPGANVRAHRWLATHLRTFRVGLADELMQNDLQDRNGQWLTRGVDVALMLPLIELAGLDRCRFIDETLYVYNYANSFEHNASAEELAHEAEVVAELRSRPSLGRQCDIG